MANWFQRIRSAASSPRPPVPPYGLLDRRIPFVNAVFRSVDDPESLDVAAVLLFSAELRHRVGLFSSPSIIHWEMRETNPDVPKAELNEPPVDGAPWDEACLLPFLGETHLLLTGDDFEFESLELCDATGTGQSCSARSWARSMAQWARTYTDARSYLGRPSDADYYTFWNSTPGYSLPLDRALYDRWLEALRAVIRHKTAIFGWTFSPRFSEFNARSMYRRPWANYDAFDDQPWPHPPAGPQAEAAAEQIYADLREFVVEKQLGRVYPSGTAFWVASAPDTVLSPACAFISRQGRKPPKSRVGWIEAKPDLVIEVRSAHDLNRRLEMRLYQWRKAGVDWIWVHDTATQTLAPWIAPGFPPPEPPVDLAVSNWLEDHPRHPLRTP